MGGDTSEQWAVSSEEKAESRRQKADGGGQEAGGRKQTTDGGVNLDVQQSKFIMFAYVY
jgi:hypothetical protein